MVRSPPDSAFFVRPQMTSSDRMDHLSGAISDVNEVVAAVALPHILRAKIPFHYPLRPRAHAPLLPTLEEMPELLARAWGPRGRTPRTIH